MQITTVSTPEEPIKKPDYKDRFALKWIELYIRYTYDNTIPKTDIKDIVDQHQKDLEFVRSSGFINDIAYLKAPKDNVQQSIPEPAILEQNKEDKDASQIIRATQTSPIFQGEQSSDNNNCNNNFQS